MTETLQTRAELLRRFVLHVPHNRAIGLEPVSFQEARVCMRLPYNTDLVGNPDTGVLHGGAICTLLDACCGAAVFMALPEPRRVATLDLRIDYLKPARPASDVIAEAECYKVTKHIAFVRSMAHDHDSGDAIASAAGTFMIMPAHWREGQGA